MSLTQHKHALVHPFGRIFLARAEEMHEILADAKRLRFMADAFLHPEKPVESTGCYCDGCYYDRPSAPALLSREEADEQAQILADAASLGRLAHVYAHPEEPVVTTDPAACARCYFDRPSAPAQLIVEEAEEQAAIMADLDALKKAARDYLHPELPVVTTDPTTCGRNYFARYSAPEQEPVEETEYRAAVLADAAALKQHAVWHAHPETPVVSSPEATARCYFDRVSAPHDAEQIVSTSAYAMEKKGEESLENHMATLESLAPATRTKMAPATGPCTSIVQSASNVQLYDLEFA